MDPNLRNIKDFLTLYNSVTELCFARCVDNFNERRLSGHETDCVDKCVNKFAKFNQHMMSVYVEIQTEINQKRLEELQASPEILQQPLPQQSPNPVIGTYKPANNTGSLPA